MPKITLFLLSLLVIVLTALLTLIFNSNIIKQNSVSKMETDAAVNQAKLLFTQKKERGEDLSNGSCLSNALMPGWVADIAHNPRQSIDDLPQNQCSAYLEGTAKHFVEIDLEGNLIKAK